MTLSEYILQIGDVRFAKKMGISRWTARDYRLGVYAPSPYRAKYFILKSRGALSWESIYTSGKILRT